MEITKGSPMKIIETDTIEMEYVTLPLIDVSVRFLYRFSTPVETVWMTDGRVRIPMYSQPTYTTLEEYITEFGINKVREMVLENTKEEDIPAEAKWLLKMNKVNLHQCKIVRVGT